MFLNLSIGSPIHILNLNDGAKYYNVLIENISTSKTIYGSNPMMMGGMVDITVSIEGKKMEFSGVLSNSSVANNNGYIITDTKEAMIHQVELTLQNSRAAIDENVINKNKRLVSDCENILKEINPVFAKESARDDAINALTERVNTMQSEFGDIKDGMSQVLSILKKENANT